MKDRITDKDWRMGLIALAIIVFGVLALTGRMNAEAAIAAITSLFGVAGIHQHHKE